MSCEGQSTPVLPPDDDGAGPPAGGGGAGGGGTGGTGLLFRAAVAASTCEKDESDVEEVEKPQESAKRGCQKGGTGAGGGGGGGGAGGSGTGGGLKMKQLTIHSEESAYEAMKGCSFSQLKSAAMHEMPETIQEEVKKYAAVKLSLLWLPRVVLSNKQKARKAFTMLEDDVQMSNQLANIIQVLTSGELIKNDWPADKLQKLGEACVPVAAQKGDRIINEGESARSGVWIILSGTGHMTKKVPSRERGAPPSEITVYRFNAPILLGDFALLTDEPRTASVICDSICACFVLPKAAFLKVLAQLTPELQMSVYEKAFARRQQNIEKFFPMTVDGMRKSPVLGRVSDTDLRELKQHLRPLCLTAGTTIVAQGTKGTAMYYLCRGRVEATLVHGSGERDAPPEVTAITPNSSPPTFGEFSYMFDGLRYAHTFVAVHHCDMWVLPFSAIANMEKTNGRLRDALLTGSREVRMAMLEKERRSPLRMARCIAMLANTAIVGETCSKDCLREVADSLEPHAYVPRDPIVSASHACDELLVFCSGKAAVMARYFEQKPTVLRRGDVIGVSLVAVHKWLFPVQAGTGCDVWSIDKGLLVAILMKYGHYSQIVAKVKRCMTEPTSLTIHELLTRRKTANGVLSSSAHTFSCLRACIRTHTLTLTQYSIPPLVHPAQGLPDSLIAPFQFESLEDSPPGSPRRGGGGGECDSEGGGSEVRQQATVYPLNEAKRLWLVLEPSAPAKRLTDRERAQQQQQAQAQEAALYPHPPKMRREFHDTDDLNEALASIQAPGRMRPGEARLQQPPSFRVSGSRPSSRILQRGASAHDSRNARPGTSPRMLTHPKSSDTMLEGLRRVCSVRT